MITFCLRSMSFKLPLTQKKQFYISVHLPEGGNRITETVIYVPQQNRATLSEDLEFIVRNPKENNYFTLEIYEYNPKKTPRETRIAAESVHIHKMQIDHPTELIIPTEYGPSAIINVTLELSDEFKEIMMDKDSPLSKSVAKRREDAIQLDNFNPLKMAPLMHEFIMSLTPLVMLKASVVEFVTWRDPHKTALLSFLFTFFMIFNQKFIAIGLIMFYIFGNKIIPSLLSIKPAKDEVKGTFNIYKRNMVMMRQLMQFTVFVDEVQNKLIHDPDKTVFLHFLQKIRKFSPIIAFAILFRDLNHVLIFGYWLFMIYHTKPGKAFLRRLYGVFSENMDKLDNYVTPVARIEEKFVKNTLSFRRSVSDIPSISPRSSIITSSSTLEIDRFSSQPQQRVLQQKMFVIYENQRWWIGKGWCTKMKSGGRSAWSDDLGQLPLTKESFRLPGIHWKWESEWYFVKNERTDEEGWEYADRFSRLSENKSYKGLVHLVRRRKWIRRCVEVDE